MSHHADTIVEPRVQEEFAMSARDLTRHYTVHRGLLGRSASVQALNGVSFDLPRGRTLAVVGESGCGKSTLARVLTLIEPPTSGRLEIAGAPADASDEATLRRLRHTVQIVFQNPYGSLNPRQTVGNALTEPLEVQGRLDTAARADAAREMMRRVGLRPEHVDRYPHMFSGGQRQRIAIARALMPRPQVLVLDEPVSALDVSVRAQVLNLLADLQQELGVAYVFISHDLSVVQHVADEVAVMYLGRVVEQGARDVLFDDPRHPYTQALLSATPSVQRERRRSRVVLQGELPSPLSPPAGCAFHARCPAAQARCTEARPELQQVAGRAVACWYAEQPMLLHRAVAAGAAASQG